MRSENLNQDPNELNESLATAYSLKENLRLLSSIDRILIDGCVRHVPWNLIRLRAYNSGVRNSNVSGNRLDGSGGRDAARRSELNRYSVYAVDNRLAGGAYGDARFRHDVDEDHHYCNRCGARRPRLSAACF